MKKMLITALLALSLMTSGCADNATLSDGHEYSTYGLFDKDDVKNPDVVYDLEWGNAVWGTIFSATIVAPVYFFGFSLWEPIRLKTEAELALEKTMPKGVSLDLK